VILSKEHLEFLRCPMDPRREARLEEVEGSLVCQCCRLSFAIKEGIPSLLVEEATLPAGCASLSDLPCQRGETTARAQEEQS
jgi:uncharacterized protein YbaR (Trm112 family)